jgi:aminopeptidase N
MPDGPRESAPSCTSDDVADVLHHAVALELQLEPAALAGRGELRLRTRVATHQIALDALGLEISAVAGAAGPLVFEHARDRLCVKLPKRLPAGRELTLQLAWTVPRPGSKVHFAPDQVWAGYHAAAWLPTLQHPAQRATLALELSVPADLAVAASGQARRQRALPSGKVQHSFVLDRPAPPFLYAFAAGRFAAAELEVDGVKLRALGPPQANLEGALTVTAAMLQSFTRKLGVPLPSEEYTQIFVHGEAAQEAAGLALLSESALDDLQKDPKDDWIFSHELAHQWFAWLVPCADFADFWLNEGFATFLVAAIKEERWGHAAYEQELALLRSRSAKVHADGRDMPLSLSAPGRRPPPALHEAALAPRGVTYARGALVLDKLRSELGEDAFWRGLQHYVKAHAWRGARSEDLRRSLEASSGRDLRAFFARWIYAPAWDL